MRRGVSGALRQRRGRFELAHKGTLLLDDIDALPATVQKNVAIAAGSEVSADRRTRTHGGRCSGSLCASREDLKDAVAHGRFLPELCDYLTAVEIIVPPLRERRDDVLVIAEHLLERSAATFHKSLWDFHRPAGIC